ncbi:uncharacterized protein [Haliotis cracherodii]|uniref:uncharacterized protein n=1 Tax=Haliotis cracherodii TaxID=6455 RepID=UPI0039E951C2
MCNPETVNLTIARKPSRPSTVTLPTWSPKPDARPSRTKPVPSPIRITIPYQGPVTHQIFRLIKNKANIDVTWSSSKSIKTHLQANDRGTSSVSPKTRGCIYQISCNCGHRYIGDTIRPLNTRLKEHQSSVNKLDLKSAISEHIIKNQDHYIMREASKVLSKNNNKDKENYKKPLTSGDTSQP